jgi:hypothetical protein
MSNIAQNHSISFKIFFTSHLQALGIPERRYDAMFAVLLPDAKTAKMFFEDKAIASLLQGSGDFVNIRESDCLATNVNPPIFNSAGDEKRRTEDEKQRGEGEKGRTKDEKRRAGDEKPKAEDEKSRAEALRFTTLLVRNQAMTFEHFVAHHKENHIKLFSSIPVIQKNIKTYTVSHKLDGIVPFESRYDGIVEFTFSSTVDMLAVFVNPGYLSKVRPDERRFLIWRSAGLLFHVGIFGRRFLGLRVKDLGRRPF